jgi:hypothetical protein
MGGTAGHGFDKSVDRLSLIRNAKMRTITKIGHLVAILCCISAIQDVNGVDSALASVSIKCQSAEIRHGAPVRLDIVVTNTSDRDLTVRTSVAGHAEDGSKIEVHDSAGQVLPRIDYQQIIVDGKSRRVPARMIVASQATSLQSHQSEENYAQLDKLFSFARPGRYEIVVTQYIRPTGEADPRQWIGVKSNTIDITIE